MNHQVLNAKQHEKEAVIIADAGKIGTVTVATNMAGRGTDIILGGSKSIGEQEWSIQNTKVLDLGGLKILGSERHESRRIDNQLRGRSGRQGDPGGTQFYISAEDDLMKRFGGDRIQSIMNMVGLDEETPIENKLLTRAVESAQSKVEGFHFENPFPGNIKSFNHSILYNDLCLKDLNYKRNWLFSIDNTLIL